MAVSSTEHLAAEPWSTGSFLKPWVLCVVATAGSASQRSRSSPPSTARPCTLELGEPLVVALLVNSITVSYVLGGLIAWTRRPESRFGPLMIAAGFANFLSTLSWTTHDVTYTIGQALDFVAPVLFLHLFLAFPSGRLGGHAERIIVVTAYATAISLELTRMAVGSFGPHNLLEVTTNYTVGLWALRVQLVLMSALLIAGVGVLAYRRLQAGKPLRRSWSLIVDWFGLGLLMIAFLFLSIVFEGPAVQEIRWATLAVMGLAPVAFLIGLLDARLADPRSATSSSS